MSYSYPGDTQFRSDVRKAFEVIEYIKHKGINEPSSTVREDLIGLGVDTLRELTKECEYLHERSIKLAKYFAELKEEAKNKKSS